MSGEVLAAVMVGAGLALLVVGLLLRARGREQDLAAILDLPYGERDVPVDAVTERGGLLQGTVDVAGRVVQQLDPRGALAHELERARIPLRPGEYVLVTVGSAGLVGLLSLAITERWLLAVAGAGAMLVVGRCLPSWRVARRRKAFETQFPDALSLIASSLTAGHTFLRAIQMMCEESEAPLSEEFSWVVYETQLGDPLVDALDRMAQRLDIRDVTWVVQAIRIQQTVGGKVSDLLHTLADFVRARQEIRREVDVLTAEGRISAWVLGGLPVLLLLAFQVMSPDYMQPLFQGWGVVVLALTGASIAAGVALILRMVKIEV
jgi:tight adherence protein B